MSCPAVVGLWFGSLYDYSFLFCIHLYVYFVAFFEREKPVSCYLSRYVDEELVVHMLSRLGWSVHEAAFSLQQYGVPFWYHNLTSAKRVSGPQSATPLW